MNVLNRDALEQLERDTSAEVVPLILNRFLGELEQRCADIRAAAASGEVDRVGLEAHSIKSAAKTFGLEQLSENARRLEATADAGEEQAVRAGMDAVLAAAAEARVALQAFLDAT